MKNLIIHPQDPTTSFLSKYYAPTRNINVGIAATSLEFTPEVTGQGRKNRRGSLMCLFRCQA